MNLKRPMMVMIALVGTCGLGAAGASAQTLYLDDDAPAAGDGLGWVTAYRFLQDALADAAGGGITEIRVAQGIYKPDQDEAANVTPGDREATFQLIDGVALRGGYRGAYDGTGMPADDRDIHGFATTLSGDLLGNDVGFVNNVENSYTVVTGSGTDVTAVLDGFTITAGNANGPDPGNLEWVRGGGMWNLTGSPTITNCRFEFNRAQRHGGGMYNHTLSSPELTACTFSGNEAVAANGGGMFNFQSSPTFTNCHFSNNSAGSVGGGMRNFDTSSPSLTDCTFSGNTASAGGGMHNENACAPMLLNCQFSGNTATTGVAGGMINSAGSDATLTGCTFIGNMALASSGGGLFNFQSSPAFTNCQFTNNSAAIVGGGMRNFDTSSPVVTDCTFSGNLAGAGAGMHNEDGCSPIVTNCEFIGNTASSGVAGGMSNGLNCSPTVINCLFTGNHAVGSGGAFATALDCFPLIVNCTIVYNTTDLSGGGLFTTDLAGGHSEATVDNCIVYFNGGLQIVNAGGALTDVSYSNVQGGYAGTGNMSIDPLLVDADGPDDDPLTFEDNDYRLAAGSACIDAADTTAVPGDITTDLDGNPRFIDDPATADTGNGVCHVDMGAYEFQQGAVVCCPADTNGDGVINVLDLINLLLCFGQPAVPGCESEDVNGDGVVNVLDLIQLLLAFGQSCP